MKRLFISDLDGTLLKGDAELSDFTRRELSSIISGGEYFTVATARTASTVTHILRGVDIKLPVILMSGVLIYDLAARSYERIIEIPSHALAAALGAAAARGISGFLYTIEGGEMLTYYENLDTPQRRKFHDERVARYGKRFARRDFADVTEGAVYFSTSGSHGLLAPLRNDLDAMGTLNVEFYRDIYNSDEWYLEFCGPTASKREAALYLKQKYGFGRVIAFGDNLNDLPLFSAADESYAVANAHGDVKRAAGAVIESNEDDGVVKQIRKIIATK